MREFSLGTSSIAELGNYISEFLSEHGMEGPSELRLTVGKDEFRKVDEDLFYRNREDGDKEFIPSEGEVDVSFGKLRIRIFSE
jgi:hypothetical protein